MTGTPMLDLLLIKAAAKGEVQTCIDLIETGADITIQECQPLIEAARNGHGPVVDMLLAYGSLVHTKDDTAMMFAVEMGEWKAVEALLLRDPDPASWPVDCIDELPKSMREKLVRGDLRKTAIEEGKRSAPDAKFSIGDVEFVPAFKARRRAVPVDVTLLEKQAMQVRTRIRGYEPSL